ncbi:hypothetical protein HCR16_05070 [Wolbachia pipientis]|uniref:hypothetical protein n=1 Tax=Wolbachia pipientis TaxID=955 RepID=UPI0015FDCB34|nr:hypothetical protein [Wolbachia pipientis]MBA8770454.1 hypothetical protein [Wolbachia pipientis]
MLNVIACFASNTKVSSQCLTLGSSKIDCEQAHYTTFSMKLQKSWIPVSSTGMTPFAVQFTFENECSYGYVRDTGMTPLEEANRLQATCPYRLIYG